MGIESYLLRLRSHRPDIESIVVYAQQSLGLTHDPHEPVLSSAYSHYVFRDGLHVIEFEFLQVAGAYEVSIRFALCHPSSVDKVFLALAVALMKRFNLIATICEELPKDEPRDYSEGDLDRFTTNCSWSIARSREYWRQMFGSEEIGLSVSDALSKFFHGDTKGD